MSNTTSAPAPTTTPTSLHISAPGSDLGVDLPVTDGAIRATDLRKIPTEDGGLMSYDPAFLNTASCRSAITYIDGDAGILRYRGYPIEEVAEDASFLETAYLLFEGELPTQEQLASWEQDVRTHTYVHTNVV